jgi:hypothetical protein
MSNTLRNGRQSDPVSLPETFGHRQLRVGLASDNFGLGGVAFDAIVAYYGSVKEAAYALGEVDPSLMRREIRACDFSRFEKHADKDAKAALVASLAMAFGPMAASPQQYAEALLDKIQAEINEVRQYIRGAA